MAVAVEAPATGDRTYTYLVPESVAGVVPGEAVIVEFGRRQALGVVLGPAPAPDVAVKAVLARVRSDGPLLPPLGLRLAAWLAGHYLAPPAVVLRAMLPPGLLERLAFVATWRHAPAIGVDLPAEVVAALTAAGASGVPVERLAPSGAARAGLLRSLRAAAAQGVVSLEWVLRPPTSGPRLRRVVRLTATGEALLRDVAAGTPSPGAGSRLGPRQRALLDELGLDPATALPAADLAARHGGSAITSLARRGLVELRQVVEERHALAARPVRAVPVRPPETSLTPDQQAAVAAVEAAVAAGRGEAFLLEGPTAAGKTAVHAEVIAAAMRRGRGAL
ncbi:MAG TPA: hypothetical protein VMH24_06005, partial [Candidatus Sulfotelmatobacter sp.]|nr:hypothetical protein [Candidatus Sulfotelmatobacter sp.]